MVFSGVVNSAGPKLSETDEIWLQCDSILNLLQSLYGCFC